MDKIKIGDQVVVSGWLPSVAVVKVARIFWEDSSGRETDVPSLAATVRLGLVWEFPDGTQQTSKVSLHDEGRSWYRYTSSN